MTTPTTWIHISERPGDPWVIPIWTVIRDAIRRGTVAETPQDVKELGVHISTRLNILPLAWHRVSVSRAALLDSVETFGNTGTVYTAATEGSALIMPMRPVYEFILDLHSVLYETHACAELMRNFMQRAIIHSGRPRARSIKQEFKRAIEQNGASSAWCDGLEAARGFFIHEGTVYVAVDVSGVEKDLLLMTENVQAFDDVRSYLRFSDLSSIRLSFERSKPAIQQYIFNLFG